MKNIFLKALGFVVFAFLSFSLTACGGDGSEVIAPPSIGDSGTSTPIGSVSGSGFWINAQNSEYPAFVNSEEGFGNECLIESDDPLGTLSCFVDIMELDLYSNEVNLQYNVPPDMCQHISITPAWHWNFSSGRGPRNITLEVRNTGAGEVVDSCSASRDDGGPNGDCTPGVDNHPEILGISESGLPNCAYDHSLRDDDLPNCCIGSYSLTKRLDSDNNGSYETITTQTYDWGGSVRTCIGGASRTGTGSTNQDGYPVTQLTQVPADGEAGLNDALSVAANSASTQTSFSYPANFYTTVGAPHNHTGFSSVQTSTFPYAVNPIDDLDGSLFNSSELRSGLPAYTFNCLDEGDEVKYSIFVFVREWNTVAEFLEYGTSEGAVYNPDLDGNEGGPCPGIGNSCNDFRDFDDILSGAGGVYNTGPGVDYLDRNTYFPEAGY